MKRPAFTVLTTLLLCALPLHGQAPRAIPVEESPEETETPTIPRAQAVEEPTPEPNSEPEPGDTPALDSPDTTTATAANTTGLADKNGDYAPIPVNGQDTDTIIRIQIHLDQHNHGPGHIDGRLGEFGKKAASVYNQVRGIPIGNWHPLIRTSAKTIPEPYTTYTIKPGDLKFIVSGLSTAPAAMAKMKYLGYGSLLELVSERFHTTEVFLQSINKGTKTGRLKPGDTLKVPNVKPFEIEDLKVHHQYPKDTQLSSHTVVVDIRARVALFFDANKKVIGSFPITPGRDKFIQFGEWKITNMVTTPEFRWDKSMLETGKRSEEYYSLPIGPNSPVGIIWTGTSRSGIGLHGTSTPHTIGRAQSAGCVRFANWDAVRLPTLIRPGSRLVIR